MSDTPRTDAAIVHVVQPHYQGDRHFAAVPGNFARTLERELAAAQARVAELSDLPEEVAQLRTAIRHYKSEVERLTAHAESAKRELRSVKQAKPVAWKVKQGARTFYVSPEEFTRMSIDNGSMEPLYAAPAAPQSGWVSVEERLPDVETPVLIAGNPYGNHGQMIALGHWDGREWMITDTQFGWVEFETEATGDDDEAENVTHWMPLPAAPGREG